MNNKSNFLTAFAIWITILPLLGIPNIWKVYLTSFSGLFLLLITLSPIVVKKLEAREKAKIKKRQPRTKNVVVSTNPSPTDIGPSNPTDEITK